MITQEFRGALTRFVLCARMDKEMAAYKQLPFLKRLFARKPYPAPLPLKDAAGDYKKAYSGLLITPIEGNAAYARVYIVPCGGGSVPLDYPVLVFQAFYANCYFTVRHAFNADGSVETWGAWAPYDDAGLSGFPSAHGVEVFKEQERFFLNESHTISTIIKEANRLPLR